MACGAPGQPCCSGAATSDGGSSMDPGAAGTCNGTATCLANNCVDCSGPTQTVCNGACVELTTNQNCGACGVNCRASERCVLRVAGGIDGGVSSDAGGAGVAFCQVEPGDAGP